MDPLPELASDDEFGGDAMMAFTDFLPADGEFHRVASDSLAYDHLAGDEADDPLWEGGGSSSSRGRGARKRAAVPAGRGARGSSSRAAKDGESDDDGSDEGDRDKLRDR
jgi:hypothetical protein